MTPWRTLQKLRGKNHGAVPGGHLRRADLRRRAGGRGGLRGRCVHRQDQRGAGLPRQQRLRRAGERGVPNPRGEGIHSFHRSGKKSDAGETAGREWQAMRIDILTLFPDTLGMCFPKAFWGVRRSGDIFPSKPTRYGTIPQTSRIRWTTIPYGGGQGAIMQADPLYRCWEAVCDEGRWGGAYRLSVPPAGIPSNRRTPFA